VEVYATHGGHSATLYLLQLMAIPTLQAINHSSNSCGRRVVRMGAAA
jgi:hypothetical protein